MMTQYQSSFRTNSPHREVGVQAPAAVEPPPRRGGYGLLRLVTLLLFTLLLALPAAAQQDNQPAIELSPLVVRVLDDDLLTDGQRRELLIFHGQWEELDEPSPREQLQLAVMQHRVDEQSIPELDRAIAALPEGEPGLADIALLAQAAYLAGRPQEGFELYADMDVALSTSEKLRIARGCEDLGQYEFAIGLISGIREQALADIATFETAADLTAAAQAIVMLARLEGRPAADFHLANQMLSRAHEELDPLYWPAYVAEAGLLWDKGNPREAMDAVTQALSLNPKSSEAWYLLGSMRCRFFDFDSANRAVQQLRAINEMHPLADALAVEIALRQKDMPTAQAAITPAIERYPTHRQLLALSAAVQALSYNEDEQAQLLEQFDELAPGNPLAQFQVGQAFYDARQYALAQPHLQRAIDMMPGWSAPQLALGKLYMDWGRLPEAADQLRAAAALDPFHKEVTNLLLVVNDMLGYETIQTDQFIVRYQAGIDEVLARDIALHLSATAEIFIARFGHDPQAMTQIDLMPDDEYFAVRLTGMPDIWTIAACTGDVIAMTPPRPGPQRAYGAYNWLNVMGHEYAHVVNLSQTNNRVPHWFTEGCAVNMETTGRLWSQYALLSRCYNNDLLFSYDEINWGFIRPTLPYHRSLAYAQSAWIMQYIEENHGWDKALQMLALYEQGIGEHETIRQVFGVEPAAFMELFLAWAGEQIQAWGMTTFAVEPDEPTLTLILSAQDPLTVDADQLEQAIEENASEPALIKIKAQQTIARGDTQAALQLITRYQAMRPVDPWSDRELARIALAAGDADTAIAAMLTLDKIEGDAPEYAVELARVMRGRNNYDRALHFAERALLREPYNATFREMAATIAVQGGDLERAGFHVESLKLLEPDRPIHSRRLSVIYQRLGREDDAATEQERAEALELLDDEQ